MKRIDADGHVSNLFTDGDPGSGVPATVLDAAWANAVQEEIAHAIEAAGIVLNSAQNNQLATAIQTLASSGGGGGGFKWTPVEGESPVVAFEYDEQIYFFAPGAGQRVAAFLKIPDGYTSGKQIRMNISLYSPASTGTVLFRTTTTLVKKNVDGISTITNQRVSTNVALVNSVVEQLRVTLLDLTDSAGKINGVSVAAGDLLKISLTRETDLDTAEVRLIPNATEIKFG